jgi:hypothetical protein
VREQAISHFGGPQDGEAYTIRHALALQPGEFFEVYVPVPAPIGFKEAEADEAYKPSFGRKLIGRYVVDGDGDFRFLRWESA